MDSDALQPVIGMVGLISYCLELAGCSVGVSGLKLHASARIWAGSAMKPGPTAE